MKTPNKTLRQTAILTTLILLTTSCATLRIDVDVYKGPLANHKDVQMEQMAVMAIGAKPLLVRLRTVLETGIKDTRYARIKEDTQYDGLLSDGFLAP